MKIVSRLERLTLTTHTSPCSAAAAASQPSPSPSQPSPAEESASRIEAFVSNLGEPPRADGAAGITFVRVRRHSLCRDVLARFSRFSASDLRKRLVVIYEGEGGVDAGGLSKDMYNCFFQELFSPSIGMFETADGLEGYRAASSSSSTSFSSSSSSSSSDGRRKRRRRRGKKRSSPVHNADAHSFLPSGSSELLSYFSAIGKVLGKLVLDRLTVQTRFAPVFFKVRWRRENICPLSHSLNE